MAKAFALTQDTSDFEDFQRHTLEFKDDVLELKKSVRHLEEKRELVRLALETFTELRESAMHAHEERQSWSPSKKRWMDTFNKLRLQTQVNGNHKLCAIRSAILLCIETQVDETSKFLEKTSEFIKNFPILGPSSPTTASRPPSIFRMQEIIEKQQQAGEAEQIQE